MTKHIYKYPYNARTEDEIKVFLFDKICEQIVKVNYKNGQLFCTIKDRITSQNKEIIFSAAIIFGVLLWRPTEARPIGVSPILFSAHEIHHPAEQRVPQYLPTFGLGPSSSSTELSVIPKKAREFNEMSLKFNQPKISCNFIMSDQEARRQVTEMYPSVLEISPNTQISDLKAAGKIYHASQLGVDPEDYGMKKEDVLRIEKIGIYKYAREGRPLPPIELIKDYQMAMKDICTNGKLLEGTYSSRADQKIHKAIYRYDVTTRTVVGFYIETGELITATKYKESTFEIFILTKNLGSLN